ncbi:MAG: citrate synthase [Chitinivibrionales bacterium]|nr:citrate synthase [Chitinivibrionales bacterium]MBD3394958.1 citrate synthase [Chitinivibrionales bacterium]
MKKANLKLGNKSFDLPVITGSEGEVGVDITSLRKTSGAVTFDNGFANTASCKSAITFVDGENGILRHRGYDIVDLVENCSFVEVAYLLVHGALPTAAELKRFSRYLNQHSMIHENMHHFFSGFPADSHPMAILASMVTSLSSFYPLLSHRDPTFDITSARLISKVRTIAAFSYKKSQGAPLVYPRYDLSYCANFLNMMFSSPVDPYEIDVELVRILNKLLILHVDHEQNCSTTAVRLIASARANLYAAISAGICALWGPLHGGANQAVIDMLNRIKNDNRNVKKAIERAKAGKHEDRLMGFGHAVYKNYDPRARLCKKMCDDLFSKRDINDPLLDIARELEEIALKDDYFVSRRLYPNVDFYTGILYRAMGIPTNMLTVMFALGRLPGWIAQWKETVENRKARIYRPRQIYTGPEKRRFVPIDQRKPGIKGRVLPPVVKNL